MNKLALRKWFRLSPVNEEVGVFACGMEDVIGGRVKIGLQDFYQVQGGKGASPTKEQRFS